MKKYLLIVFTFFTISSIYSQTYEIKKIYSPDFGFLKVKGEIEINDSIFIYNYNGLHSEIPIKLVSETSLGKQYKDIENGENDFSVRISFFPKGILNDKTPKLTYELRDSFSGKYTLLDFYLKPIQSIE
jgi:hypothetical protein